MSVLKCVCECGTSSCSIVYQSFIYVADKSLLIIISPNGFLILYKQTWSIQLLKQLYVMYFKFYLGFVLVFIFIISF